MDNSKMTSSMAVRPNPVLNSWRCQIGRWNIVVATCLLCIGCHSDQGKAGDQERLTHQTDEHADQALSPNSEFDFLIGVWDIDYQRIDPDTGMVSRRVRARQHARYTNNRRMIIDEWTGFDPVTGDQVSHGVTLRSFSEADGNWHHAYLQSSPDGPPSSFAGRMKNGEMHAEGRSQLIDGRVLRFRLRFHQILEMSYAWDEEWSVDDGLTWHRAKSYTAARA